jgi:hypothetical protein
MIPLDKGIRDLLPPLKSGPDEIAATDVPFDGSPAAMTGAPSSTPPTTYSAAELPAAQGYEGTAVMTPVGSPPSPAGASHGTGTSGEEAEGPHIVAVISFSEPQAFVAPKLDVIVRQGGVTDQEESGQKESGQGNPKEEPEQGALKEEPERASGGDGNRGDTGHEAEGPGGAVAEADDPHSIRVNQYAFVHQDADIIVNGYVGEVVARLYIDQDLMMDQSVDLDFAIDGDGHFTVLLDQNMRIDQDIDIEIEIYDIDGVLYLDIFLRDSIEVEQDMAIDVSIGDGTPGGTVEVNQDIALDQDVDIHIDIEDDLEERYAVDVGVDVLQEVDTRQNAVVDVQNVNGEIDLDLDATQTASVDQQTIVQADFTLIS